MNDMHGRERLDDIPPIFRWVIVFIKEVGFPVAVAIYMGYVALTSIPKMTASLEANTETMRSLAVSVDKNQRLSERAFRRILGDRYPDD